MLEKEIERKYGKQVKKDGGLFLKFVSPGNAGVPDRIVISKDGALKFVEFKKPGEKLEPLQKYWKAKLEGYGFVVEVVDYAV